MGLAKKFGQLKKEDNIYLINPLDHKVVGLPILHVKVNATQQLYIDITYYTLSSMAQVEDGEEIDIEDMETTTLAAPMGADFCLSMGQMPTAYCTDKGKLEAWVAGKK